MGELVAVFGLDWKLLVAQGVNFVVLLAILRYFLYGPVMRMLADRAARIAEGLKDAEEAQKAREATEAERTGIVSQAHHEAEVIVARGEERGKEERATIVKHAHDRAAEILRDAELEAEEARRLALKESEVEIARAAILAAEKILQKS